MPRAILLVFLLVSPGLGCSAGSDTTPTLPDGSIGDTGPGARDAGPGGPDAGPRPDAGECALELCDNGTDDDCDGVVEEDCPCLPGSTQSCFGGAAGSRGVGACGDGTQTCEAGLEFGTWTDCDGDVLAGDEVCDGALVDEDCDGAANEGCECVGDEPVPCGVMIGACRAGLQECIDGRRGECIGVVGPGTEACNGTDDDCDGTVDEGISRACGSDVGECRPGTETCIAGAWEACSGARAAADETCDGLDNDCDGMTDEGLMRACGTTMGACRAGMQSCSDGAWSTCTGETLPMVETCNGVDDDCDGTVDDGLTRACGTDVGVCAAGTERCAAGVWGACMGAIGPATEICEGSRDEDCDGATDEGCTCTIGATRTCGTDVGECAAGMQMCVLPGMWGMCTGGTGPSAEVCDGRDNDCDGTSDEGGICPTSPPTAMCPGAITAAVLTTITLSGGGADPDGGAVTYRWTVRARPTGSTANPATPTAATTTFFLDAAGTYDVELCVTDDEMETTCCTVRITSTAPGDLHVELSWSTAHGDADLHLLNVGRSTATDWWSTNDCHWRNPTPDWGPAGANANPTLDRDDTDGYGPENITISMNPAAGTYTIGAHYYCQRSVGTGGIAPGDGPTVGTVRVYCGGALVATYSDIRLDRTDDWVDVATVDWPSCAGRSVGRRTTGLATSATAGLAAPHCEIACMADRDCPSGERCQAVVGPGGRRNICVRR
jgi:hypothetical protein